MAETSALREPLGNGTVVDSDPVGLRGAVLGGETDWAVGHVTTNCVGLVVGVTS
jgi:hypothetical protein